MPRCGFASGSLRTSAKIQSASSAGERMLALMQEGAGVEAENKARRVSPAQSDTGPGQLTTLQTELLTLREDMAAVRVKVLVDGRWTSRAEQIFAFNAVALDDPADQARVEQCERDELARLWADYPGDF